jgi:hypothetical protein
MVVMVVMLMRVSQQQQEWGQTQNQQGVLMMGARQCQVQVTLVRLQKVQQRVQLGM